MRKLFFLLLTLFLITTLFGCAKVGYYSNNPSSMEKPTLIQTTPIIKNTPDSTAKPTMMLDPTSTPTSTPDPYIFESSTGEMDLSTGQITINFDSGALRDIKVTANLISPKNLGGFNSTKEGLQFANAVEKGISVIRPDIYGNLLIGCHDGYYNNKPLNCEKLRRYLENWGKEGDKHVEEKLLEMVGSTGTISTEEASLEFKVLGGVRLNNSEMFEVNSKPEEVVNIVTKKKDGDYIALGNAEIFEGLKKDSHEILINFCGWGPDENYTYYRYVILLEVKENEQTPD